MGDVDPVATALEAAVAADPEGKATQAVRLHLAGVLLQKGQAERALFHADEILARAPRDESALSIAAAASHALGDQVRADGYRSRAADLLDASGAALAAHVPLTPSSFVPTPDQPLRDGPTLDDVAGMEDVKLRLRRSFLAPLSNPAVAEAFSKALRGGLLLWGPPGCGKTYIARALAGQLGARFTSLTPADIYGSFFGQSEQNVAAAFADARAQAPSLVFFDEIDALGGRRSARLTDQARSVVNQLLAELDGMEENAGVYVLAATNAPWAVDGALRRPGRFDRSVLVLPPDAPARLALLEMSLRGRPCAADLDVRSIVSRTETYSGADLVGVVDAATELALERSLDAGITSPISDGDLRAASSSVRPSTHDWFAEAGAHASFSDGDDYDALRSFMRSHRLR